MNEEVKTSDKENSLTFNKSDNPRITNLAEKSPIVARANHQVILFKTDTVYLEYLPRTKIHIYIFI